MTKIGLVACCSSKLEHAAPARVLYISPLFKKSVSFATRNCSSWFILSAKYGLVDPDQKIEPYNVTLSTMTRQQRELWGRSVSRQIRERIPATETLLLLAGKLYALAVEHVPNMVINPMVSLPIGKRLQWLSTQ